MREKEIINTIIELSYSQGCWGRLYEDLMELKSYCLLDYKHYIKTLEKKKFRDQLELLMFLEGN